MVYSYFVEQLVRQSFDHVNNHRWNQLLTPVAPNVHHRFGDSHRGLHVISMRSGKVYALDVFEDSQEVDRGLAAQAAAGLKEAVAEQIVS